MNLFEFLFVIVAIVLALGIAELLGGVARILRGELTSSGLHALWIVIVFQLQVQLAWGLWGLHSRPAWRYPEFLLLLCGPILAYLAASLLYPTGGAERAEAHLLRRNRPFFLLNAGYVAITGLYSWFLYGEGWVPAQTTSRVVVIAGLVTLAITRKRWAHWTVGLLILAGHLMWTYQYVFIIVATPTRP